jgi:hypothetical protein
MRLRAYLLGHPVDVCQAHRDAILALRLHEREVHGAVQERQVRRHHYRVRAEAAFRRGDQVRRSRSHVPRKRLFVHGAAVALHALSQCNTVLERVEHGLALEVERRLDADGRRQLLHDLQPRSARHV